MNPQQDQRQWFLDLLQQPVTGPAIEKTFEGIELPDRKQEAWRYTDLTRLYQQIFRIPDEPFDALIESDIEDWVYPVGDSYRVVLVNGRFNPQLSMLPSDPSVTLGAISQSSAEDRRHIENLLANTHEFNQDAFDELNLAINSDGLLLHVRANTRVDKPIEVVYLNLSWSANALASTRSLVLLENGAEATLVERFVSTGDSLYFFNGLTRIEMKDHARLVHHRMQQESNQAFHLDRVYLNQQASSAYSGLNIATGGCWSRSDTIANLDGEGAECELSGLYTVDAQQYNDMHIDVRHLKPHCRSREHYKGIVNGMGRAVFDGRILVEQDAQKSDAELTNKNLLLAENAEIDTKPQLEIYADDVKCSHGTTVGKIDPDQLYYCRARGISQQQAIKLLCIGFADQVISNIDDPAVYNSVHRQISNVLTSGEDV